MATAYPDNPGSPAAPGSTAPGARAASADMRLRLDDILKLMVADGLILPADGERIARSRTQRFEHPLELIAEQKLKSLKPPYKLLLLEPLVEWLAQKLGIPYRHIDPLKVELGAVTATMSNAYAERYRILPVAVDRGTLTVATGEPFVRSWADELSRSLRREIQLVFSNAADIRR